MLRLQLFQYWGQWIVSKCREWVCSVLSYNRPDPTFYKVGDISQTSMRIYFAGNLDKVLWMVKKSRMSYLNKTPQWL